MRQPFSRWLVVRASLGLVGSLATLVIAQEPVRPLVDPTQPNPELREKLEALKPRPDPGRALGGPALTLRGRMLISGQPPLALLEVDGRLQVVRTGTVINLGGRQTLRIAAITPAELRIEVEPTKDLITLH